MVHNTARLYWTDHDEDLLCTGADPLFCFVCLVRVLHAESDSMPFAILSVAALVDGIQGLLFTASQVDVAELSTASYGHEQVWQVGWTGCVADGHHCFESDVMLCHELTRDQGFKVKAILIRLDLQKIS